MRISFLLFSVFALAASCNTQTGDTEVQRLREETFRLRQENDSLKRVADRAKEDTTVRDTFQPAEHPLKNPSYPRFPGKHAVTLQWISWEYPGYVTISPGEKGWYSIRGGQTDRNNPDNYLKISGRIRPVTARELVFEGTIESRIDHLNEGKACVRNGQKTFKASGNRKYWRLQDMTNCEGGTLDYIDIYF
ncbi:MAG TPA: hypothetical protein VGE26_12395 [Sphingobacteriaceae bacterium]